MSGFPEAFDFVIGREGGYNNDPRDPGGETKYGISKRSYPDLDIASLTLDDARRIYQQHYWDRVGGDELPAPLALVVFDTAVHSGVSRALKFLDGTKDWRAYVDARLDWLKTLDVWKTYPKGFQNRIDALRREAEAWEAEVTTDRQHILNAALKVVGGVPLKRFSPDTIKEGGMCAQLAREVVEGALGLEANTWEVALRAHEYRKERGGVVRWASDYELAGRHLKLDKDPDDALPGDIFYWRYTKDGNAYGHTAIFLGDVKGLGPAVLENSDWSPAKRREQGARTPLGSDTHVFVSPLSLFPTPTTTITPTFAIRKAEQPAPEPVVIPALPPTRPTERLPFVEVQDRAGNIIRTPYTQASYYGVRFQRVPGGVRLLPPEVKP
jgi:hypothetical protein